MRKLMGLLILAGMGFAGYTVLSDSEIRNRVFNTIEKSTGFALNRTTHRSMDNAIDSFISDLGSRNKQFQKSLDAWGKDFLNKLNSRQLRRLKRDLKREADKGGDNLDKILDEYLSKAEINSL